MTADTQIKHKKVHFYKYLYKKNKEQKKKKKVQKENLFHSRRRL